MSTDINFNVEKRDGDHHHHDQDDYAFYVLIFKFFFDFRFFDEFVAFIFPIKNLVFFETFKQLQKPDYPDNSYNLREFE